MYQHLKIQVGLKKMLHDGTINIKHWADSAKIENMLI
jgi:hypothetical protein